MWLNVDKPTGKCKLHNDSQCRFVLDKKETNRKGIVGIKDDGGWLYFPSESDALAYKE